MSLPLVCTIVLENKRSDDTLACIESLCRSNYKNNKILLLENEGTNSSGEAVSQKYPEVSIISLRENLGYAGNNNIGIEAALEQGAEWIFVLNNDTELDPCCISAMIEAGECDASVGIVGPMVYHFDEPDVIQSAGGVLGESWLSTHRGMNETDNGQFKSVSQVDWVSGCAILVRRAVIEQAGALDSEYFMYWEETEWCIRAGRAGWKVIQVPHAKLWHKGVKRSYEPRPYVTYYMTRNQLFTQAKHKAPLRVRVHTFGKILQTLLSWSIKPRWRNKRDHRNAMWRGLLDFLRHRTGPMPS